jgi:hypothetical protein
MAYARMLWQLQRARMAVAAGSYACCSRLGCLLQRARAGTAVAGALLSFRSTSVLTYADVWRMLTYEISGEGKDSSRATLLGRHAKEYGIVCSIQEQQDFPERRANILPERSR